MAENMNFPKVVLKKKQIPVLIEFCLDESIEFSVKQQTFPETDWEVEVRVKDYTMAVFLGMFLRENRFELPGADSSKLKKPQPVKKADEKPEPVSVKSEPKIEVEEEKKTEYQSPTLM